MISQLIVAVIAAVASLFNLDVGEGGLRISLGIVVMIVALYRNPKLNAVSTSLITGFAVFFARILMEATIGGELPTELIFSYSIEIVFFLAYGLFYQFLVRNEKTRTSTPLILLLMLADFGANATEYLVRFILMQSTVVQMDLFTIFLAAFIRSAMIWLILQFFYREKEIMGSDELSNNRLN